MFTIQVLIYTFFCWIVSEDNEFEYGCTLCGPSPTTVLADGTNCAFSKDKLLPTSHPLYEKYLGKAHCKPVRNISLHELEKETSCIDESSCQKVHKTRQTKTGGIFLVVCSHAVVYEWHFMARHEGRKDLFYSLVRYFENFPRYIYYDFACAAANYCRKRDRRFLKTYFVIDSFHTANHTCDETFHANTNRYVVLTKNSD